MGDVADDIVEGRVCQECGVFRASWLEKQEYRGYPWTCRDCKAEKYRRRRKALSRRRGVA